jgi:hypothetical protein
VVLLLLTGASIQLTIVSNRKDPASSEGLGAGNVLKLLALFLQHLFIVGSLPVPWPPALLALMSVSDWVFAGATGQALAWATAPLECVLKGSPIPSAVAKQLIYLCMPGIVTVTELAVFWSIYTCCCCRQKRAGLFPVVLLVSAFFTFPMWVTAVFSSFQCLSVVDPTLSQPLWWVQDMAQACYHGYHRIWVFVIVIPCLVL